MTHHHARQHNMDHSDILAWGANTVNTMVAGGEEDLAADVDEPPEHRNQIQNPEKSNFHRSMIRLPSEHQQSLLTRALADHSKSDAEITSDFSRRRSLLSNTSAASTVDLTSDGGITSPARTNTPSPPPPSHLNFAPYTFGSKPRDHAAPTMVKLDSREPAAALPPPMASVPQPDPAVVALVKKRCISFACGAQKPKSPVPVAPKVVPESETQVAKPARRCMIKFACPGPKSLEKQQPTKESPAVEQSKPVTPFKSTESFRRRSSRSPSLTRKPRPTPPPASKVNNSLAARNRKARYIEANEEALLSSEAIRFHEFASDEPQEDDWIRKDVSETKAKLTINDTLEKENRIRRLGNEAEEEALQDEEDEDDVDGGNDSDENDDEDDEDDEDNEDEDGIEELDYQDDDLTVEGSDGNETDNEAGFADSDDESDAAGDFQFWTPGRPIFPTNDATMIRPSSPRAASESSIDSLNHMSPLAEALANARGRKPKSRRIKIRPGTPDLPDSTDFVCGTLDEDRPLEDAYVSCMEARKRQKHFLIPQDIDPSFPTSDPEDAEENDEDEDQDNDSDEHVWLHGQFEDSENDGPRRRRRSIRSPGHSPKRLHSPAPLRRLHSPPPAKHRHRSPPPPRRLFGGSPRRFRSPPPARHIKSPPASPTTNATISAIAFGPLGQRPGLTHTKSLPRAPNAFAKRYHEARLVSINSGADSSDAVDGHSRGAIDIVKGLEQKRLRRKEKYFQKHCNRARKNGQPERKPQPGKGAERMRELGLLMAGKTESRIGKAEFVLSI